MFFSRIAIIIFIFLFTDLVCNLSHDIKPIEWNNPRLTDLWTANECNKQSNIGVSTEKTCAQLISTMNNEKRTPSSTPEREKNVDEEKKSNCDVDKTQSERLNTSCNDIMSSFSDQTNTVSSCIGGFKLDEETGLFKPTNENEESQDLESSGRYLFV